ncbi:PREDICTED: pyridine nucleotide-disulfide oxidoreductase domain-containing protein 1 [Nicrophorus vespilloides]|uniref:Pyridine nucleotide-disulfide oxidoreductase domain-containing protein 1 n=1 Tax=Nicrophorus vespilloides TaxID=110193 RepID=A0ABM1MC26_NICVS|nr:PREDICTED: pyridine nucleotide-disulfide oxidoreductase domain-containing protein 1 [Nicrophorus vespilloides]
MEATFVVVGGGIAGVTCAETLAFYEPDESIILLSQSSLIKSVTNLLAITQTLTRFDIEEKHMNTLSDKHPNVTVIQDSLIEILDECNVVKTMGNKRIKYKYLCLCLGARPKLIADNNPYVIGIRDTDSVEQFLAKLGKSKRVVIVGNGGIASELVYKMEKIHVDWVIKDDHISATFIDPGAAEFLRTRLQKTSDFGPSKRMRYECDGNVKRAGAALGPDWYKHLEIQGGIEDCFSEQVHIHYQTEIVEVSVNEANEFAVEVTLNNGGKIQCDFIVSATGVEPMSDFKITTALELSEDKGIKVDEFMQSSVKNIYVAGDLCTADWEHAKQWFPMKLWTQARQMGCYAAKSMSSANKDEVVLQDFCFELFTHTTKLFGYKVVLLGLYNGQKLGKNYEIIFRMTKGVEYIKLVLLDGRLHGAVLIGETDLEEMCENLILNQIDLSSFKEDLLNPDVDIEDYFD